MIREKVYNNMFTNFDIIRSVAPAQNNRILGQRKPSYLSYLTDHYNVYIIDIKALYVRHNLPNVRNARCVFNEMKPSHSMHVF